MSRTNRKVIALLTVISIFIGLCGAVVNLKTWGIKKV